MTKNHPKMITKTKTKRNKSHITMMINQEKEEEVVVDVVEAVLTVMIMTASIDV